MISDRSIGIRKTIHDVCTVVQDMLKEVKKYSCHANTTVVGFCRATRQCAARIRNFILIGAQNGGRCAPPPSGEINDK
jgi:hypothetical protein